MTKKTPESNGDAPLGFRADSRIVQIYDTTLRDGTQREGISYTVEDKIKIAQRLDAFGVTFIEGGWPGSNPKDAEFFARARDCQFKHALMTAFGSTRRAQIAPEDDPSMQALLEAGTPACTLFGKSWTLHVTEVLRTTLDENLRMIEDSVALLRKHGRRVVYDAEHFFDGYKADPVYAVETLRAAVRGGAEVVALCETNGGNLPWRVEEVVRNVQAELDGFPVGIHAHDDTGCGVANSVAAVRAGARHVQGTINGYGERCGNANLCTIMANLELKLDLHCVGSERLVELFELSRFVADIANITPDEHAPYVGRSAFAHKGGVHVAAMRRNADSYQHITPELVGNRMRVVVSELSGRGNVLSKAEELGLDVEGGDDVEALRLIKEAEARGLSYESAEASVALVIQRRSKNYVPLFSVLDYQVTVGKRKGSETYAEAVVKVQVGDQVMHTAAEGNGPVSAMDAALRKALTPVYPDIKRIQLADYKVRILDSSSGTGATTRVLIDSRDETRLWSTVGASSNIIEASQHALVDAIEYGLRQLGAEPADGVGRGVDRPESGTARARGMEAR
jgi:2-isopropylmalate synthase